MSDETERVHFCPECGVVDVDQDECCAVCGATAAGAALDQLLADFARVQVERDEARAEADRLRRALETARKAITEHRHGFACADVDDIDRALGQQQGGDGT